MSFYEGIRQEHWLRDKQDEGKNLILNDDSSWEVHPSERFMTARWLRGSTIIVEYTEKGAYPYLLRNRTEGEVARVNFLREFRAVS
jgi:RecB family endonuclease NucS